MRVCDARNTIVVLWLHKSKVYISNNLFFYLVIFNIIFDNQIHRMALNIINQYSMNCDCLCLSSAIIFNFFLERIRFSLGFTSRVYIPTFDVESCDSSESSLFCCCC